VNLNLAAAGSEWDAGERTWTATDAILYALGVGSGADDPLSELEFTTENSREVTQKVLPTFAVMISGSGSGPELGDFDHARLLHAEQSITLHGELPAAATARTTGRVDGIYDKGNAALVVLSSASVNAATGEPLARSRTTLFIRGEGGFGGERGSSEPWHLPNRPADLLVTYQTRPDQALLYRLSGDRNPLHSDPWLAKLAGFDRPILHGLCTYGFTGRALLHGLCESDPVSFGSMSARFSAPVQPGQSLGVHIWEEDGAYLFQARAGEVVVLDRGVFTKRS
jgi:acyl dehydratase